MTTKKVMRTTEARALLEELALVQNHTLSLARRGQQLDRFASPPQVVLGGDVFLRIYKACEECEMALRRIAMEESE